jgi:hypothetical protein
VQTAKAIAPPSGRVRGRTWRCARVCHELLTCFRAARRAVAAGRFSKRLLIFFYYYTTGAAGFVFCPFDASWFCFCPFGASLV